MSGNKRKVLVTGAAGFVGSAVVSELQNAESYQIYGIVSDRKKYIEHHNPALEIFPADISSYETLRETEKLKDVDTVVHSAGLAHQFGRAGREDFWKVNVHGTENICCLARCIGARHLILISSVSVYGDHGNAEIEEKSECRPAGDYAESKLAAEKKAIEFCEKSNLRLTVLRLATVIGEGDRGNTTRLITTIDKNRFFWIGKGNNKKSLIYRNDVAKGILRAIEKSSENGIKIYNLTAEAVYMTDIVDIISQNLRRKPPQMRIPESLVRLFLGIGKLGSSRFEQLEITLNKWLSDDIFSGKKFREDFGFEPETRISDALARQVRFYVEQKRNSEL